MSNAEGLGSDGISAAWRPIRVDGRFRADDVANDAATDAGGAVPVGRGVGPVVGALTGLTGLVMLGLVLCVATTWLATWAARVPGPWAEALGVAVLVLLTASVVTSGRPQARRLVVADRLRGRREVLYDDLLDLWATGPRGPVAQTALRALERRLALIGSTPVLNHYASLRDLGPTPDPGPELDRRLGALVAAMRGDLLPRTARADRAMLARLLR